MSNNPKVSIITAVLNDRAYIEGAIQSVLGQTYPDIEYLVIDGGSTDGTADIIHGYKNRITKIISEKDSGIYDAWNKGIRLATGDIIGILNSDDVYSDRDVIRSAVEKMVAAGVAVCWGDMVYVRRDDISKTVRVWKSSDYAPGLFWKGWHPPHPGFFVRKSAYDTYGMFRLDLGLAADYELQLRFLERYRVSSAYIPRCLVRMREGGAGHWRNIFNIAAINMQCYQSWKVNGLRASPLIIFTKPFSKIPQLFRKEFPRGRLKG